MGQARTSSVAKLARGTARHALTLVARMRWRISLVPGLAVAISTRAVGGDPSSHWRAPAARRGATCRFLPAQDELAARDAGQSRRS